MLGEIYSAEKASAGVAATSPETERHDRVRKGAAVNHINRLSTTIVDRETEYCCAPGGSPCREE